MSFHLFYGGTSLLIEGKTVYILIFPYCAVWYHVFVNGAVVHLFLEANPPRVRLVLLGIYSQP